MSKTPKVATGRRAFLKRAAVAGGGGGRRRGRRRRVGVPGQERPGRRLQGLSDDAAHRGVLPVDAGLRAAPRFRELKYSLNSKENSDEVD